MKHSNVILAGLLAAGIVLAGCASQQAGNPKPGGNTSNSMSMPKTPASPGSKSKAVEGSAKVDPSKSVSGSAGADAAFDEPTKQWFSAMCDGAAPLKEFANTPPMTGGDPAANMKKLGNGLTKAGKSFQDASKKLAGMPAPKVTKGQDLAKATVAAFDKMGKSFTEAGTKASGVTAENAKAVASAVGTTLTNSSKEAKAVIKGAQDGHYFNEMMKVPSCAALR